MKLCTTYVCGLKSFYILNITSTDKPLPSCVQYLWNKYTPQAEGLLHSEVPLMQSEIHYPKQNGNNSFLGRE
jgi:hypothetical protein